MAYTQKTICVIQHNNNKLAILKFMDPANLMALALSGGAIVWVYRGMAMLIPAARIANMASMVEAVGKIDSKKSCFPQFMFTVEDVIILPKEIANALLSEDVESH